MEMLAKIKQKIRCGIGAEEDDSSAPIHFTYLNYILQIGKQSQEVAIVIDDVVIL